MSACSQNEFQTEEDAEVNSRTEEDVEVQPNLNLNEVDEVECTGELCNRYGLSFGTCILHHFPVDKLVIEDVMRECHYVDGRDSDALSNREKRFCLYYWYSANVYMVCGKHNRCQLPDCLIGKIRNTYPNTDGSAYIGFGESVSSNKRKKTAG